MVPNGSVVIMLSTAAVVGCAADTGFLCQQAAVLTDIVTDRQYCIYFNALLGCLLKFGA
jgi:hypothetical protein